MMVAIRAMYRGPTWIILVPSCWGCHLLRVTSITEVSMHGDGIGHV